MGRAAESWLLTDQTGLSHMMMIPLALEKVVCSIEKAVLFAKLRSAATQALCVLMQVSVPLVVIQECHT